MRPCLASILFMLLAVASPGSAQEQGGAVEGTVLDVQRGVLPGATIVAVHVALGVSVSTAADGAGTFRFPALAPGDYEVTASLAGFSTLKFARVEVLLGQIKRLAFVLELAPLTEEVRVSPSSP